jgi:Glycosyl transferase family 2
MKDLTPDVAVVVPSHDRPLRLRWLLNALEDQTHHAFEVIVVHDSGDETEAVLRDHPLARAGVLRHRRLDPGQSPPPSATRAGARRARRSSPSPTTTAARRATGSPARCAPPSAPRRHRPGRHRARPRRAQPRLPRRPRPHPARRAARPLGPDLQHRLSARPARGPRRLRRGPARRGGRGHRPRATRPRRRRPARRRARGPHLAPRAGSRDGGRRRKRLPRVGAAALWLVVFYDFAWPEAGPGRDAALPGRRLRVLPPGRGAVPAPAQALGGQTRRLMAAPSSGWPEGRSRTEPVASSARPAPARLGPA